MMLVIYGYCLLCRHFNNSTVTDLSLPKFDVALTQMLVALPCIVNESSHRTNSRLIFRQHSDLNGTTVAKLPKFLYERELTSEMDM